MAWGKITTIRGPAGPSAVSADANNAISLGGDSLIYLSNQTYLARAGGTMTGALALAADPTVALGAATKQYVDTSTGKAVPLAGGSMTGLLLLSGPPTDPLGAATKTYVDSAVVGGVTNYVTLDSAQSITGQKTFTSTVIGITPVNGSDLTTKAYVDAADALAVPLAGGTMGGLLVLSGPPTAATGAATKQYVDTAVGNYLPLTGGSLTGPLNLSADPTAATQAANKNYVDAQVSAYASIANGKFVALAGSAMTGPLIISGDPTLPNGAANKNYVDTGITNLTNTAAATYVALAGSTMTGLLVLSADPTGALGAATKQYADKMVPLAGGTMTGALTLSGDPTVDAQAATKHYVDTALSPLLGDYVTTDTVQTITGQKTFSQTVIGVTPVNAVDLTTKGYVDTSITNLTNTAATTYVKLGGSTMTGLLVLSADPGAALGAATKQYVDNAIGTVNTNLTTNYVTLGTSQTISGSKTFSSTVAGVDPAAPTDLATKGYVDSHDALAVPLAGGTMTGFLILSGDPSNTNGAATKNYVDTTAAGYLPLTGGTLTGAVTLPGNPTLALQAAPKQYVDTMVPLAGAIMTGALTLNADPSAPLGAATKQYVDALSTNLTTNYVTLGTAQTIAGQKTFTATIIGIDPINPTDVVIKRYVDQRNALYLPLAGGNMTGGLGFVGDQRITFDPGGGVSSAIDMDQTTGNVIVTALAGPNAGKNVNLTSLAWGGSVIPDATGTPASGNAWGRLNGAWTEVNIVGPTGAIGPQGPQGVVGPVGPPGAHWVGTWSAATAYNQYDAVLYNGSSYICTAATIAAGGAAPDVNASWQLVAQEGAIGPQGPQGSQGVAGAAAYDTLTAAFTMPAVNSTAAANVNNGAAFGVGVIVYVSPVGYLSVNAVAGNVLTLQNLGYGVNQAPGSIASAGATVSGTGPSGPQGIQGIQGVTGATGTAATADAGTTTTLAPGSASTVSNVGSTAAAVFNFAIARGSEWFTGSGAPPASVTGSLPGDFYLDSVSGDVYQLA